MQVPTNEIDKWELLLGTINKDTVPLNCVKKILFKLKSNKQKTINIKRLRDEGLTIEEIEVVVTRSMMDMSNEIVNMDFVIDVKTVAEYIQPITDKLLEKL